MSSRVIRCLNGDYYLDRQVFQGSIAERDCVPVLYTSFGKKDSAVLNVCSLLEQYVGNFNERARLVEMMRSVLIGRPSIGKLYTICGYRSSGKTTFQRLLQKLLGGFMMEMPRYMIDGVDIPPVQTILETPVRILWTEQMPDSESTAGLQYLMENGLSILFFTDEDDQYWNDEISPFVEPTINFDSSFVQYPDGGGVYDSGEMLYPVDPDFGERLDGMLEPLLWTLCNFSSTEF